MGDVRPYRGDVRPYLVDVDPARGRALSQIPQKEAAFAETWLQQLLFQHPLILPIEELDEAFSPLIPIGREIAQIDDLFISPSGLLTLVETKLWRNPEAHRVVVAQILDYVNTLTTWSYDKLDESVKHSSLGKSKSIYEIVKDKSNFELDEIEFRSRVQDCLSNGRFALLIVGDKIFPEATQLVDLIQSAPNLKFTFGFVELRCYRIEKDCDWPLIVIPHFVAKTKEFTRAVITVVYEGKQPEVQMTSTEQTESSTGSKTNLKEFVASLPTNIRDDFESKIRSWSRDYIIHWGKSGFTVNITWKKELIIMFEAYPYAASIMTEKFANRYDLPVEIFQEYKTSLLKSSILGSQVVQTMADKKFPNYSTYGKDDIDTLLKATDQIINKLSQMSNKTT